MPSYSPAYDPVTGRCIGVLRDDGAQIPRDDGNADWLAFEAWQATVSDPVSLADVPPPVPTPEQLAQRAVAALLGSTDPATVGVVSLFRLAFTMINDEREHRGADRIQEPQIIEQAAALLIAAAQGGPA